MIRRRYFSPEKKGLDNTQLIFEKEKKELGISQVCFACIAVFCAFLLIASILMFIKIDKILFQQLFLLISISSLILSFVFFVLSIIRTICLNKHRNKKEVVDKQIVKSAVLNNRFAILIYSVSVIYTVILYFVIF